MAEQIQNIVRLGWAGKAANWGLDDHRGGEHSDRLNGLAQSVGDDRLLSVPYSLLFLCSNPSMNWPAQLASADH